ncbi:hypothetical protein M413DRAFT_445560 [Hebeloma cylindrosporum]|uniref:Uncharacterized protein n=1 Tax=Hebeloma cylindrosporum TaxID=76867 RepID=A0A0C2YKQ5_HEBCY|nr:hypothetical protein M413DRAFT_445560 [Hebeloma cylindrosporum h7]
MSRTGMSNRWHTTEFGPDSDSDENLVWQLRRQLIALRKKTEGLLRYCQWSV